MAARSLVLLGSLLAGRSAAGAGVRTTGIRTQSTALARSCASPLVPVAPPPIATRVPRGQPRGRHVSWQRRGETTRVHAQDGDGAVEVSSVDKTAGKAAAAVASLLYVYWVFLSDTPPGNMVLRSDPLTLKLALDCSINFWFVNPVLLPHIAPDVHPVMEGLFNLVVTWTIMMAGFATEARQQTRVNTLAFLAAMPFLTNAIYLPYLALRDPAPQPLPRGSALSSLEKAVESPWFGRTMALVGVLCLAWGALGRSEYGELAERVATFKILASTDRVGWAFCVDLLCLSAFQSFLVGDDMKRRGFEGTPSASAALLAARLVPYFGLAYYLSVRPSLASSEAQR